MIKVRAYGHIGKALGKEELEIDKEEIRVRDILELISSSNFKLSPLTMLITINGVEISALNKEDTIIKSGDKVVLIPITHGG
ncbi:MAG: MoaD/ThiS family protein [archaeon]|nr:MoaD/ThiS family protein [archaeon]MCP8317142.1 MoaD/ThiS family protein [archaeon]MCP8321897.1 MoaD/ThiS family protein [archaeon]